MTTESNGKITKVDKVDRQYVKQIQQTSMVRMSGSNLYGSTSSAASRSRRASSGEKASLLKPETSASTGEASNASKTIVLIPVPPYQGGTESNNSVRSTGSGSTSSRKLQKSFRRTKMFHRNKRNSNDVIAKSQISVVSQTSDTDQSTSGRSLNRFHSHRSASRGNCGRAVANSTVEEREAGADSPTFPPPKQTSPAHTQSQKQSPEESQSGNEIPQGHIDNILRFYGGDNMSSASLDLYRDVLKVSPDASDREIRIAYFRRGREILGDNSAKPDEATLDPKMKARFQAVSMAFEILSTPSWKETYLQEGLRRSVSKDIPNMKAAIATRANGSSNVDPFSSPPSTVAAAFRKTNNDDIGMQNMELKKPPASSKPKVDVAQKRRKQRQMLRKLTPTMPQISPQTMPQSMPPALPLPALRKSSFTNGSTPQRTTRSPTQRSSSVRWKDHVEELVFANHPNEHAYENSDSDSESNDEEDVLEQDEIAERERIRKNTLQNTFGNSGGKQANGKMNSSNGASSGSKKRKKNKPRIVIDSEELESHLQLIDDEAEKHFVKDFWDNFEESMDGILSLVDSIGGGDASKKASTKNPSWLSPPAQFSRSKQRNVPRGNRDATDSTIKRSLSHEATVSPKSKVVIDYNSEELMKRSNSSPRSSPSSLDAISPLDTISPSPQAFDFSQSGSATARVVSPDEKGAKAKLSPVRVPSPTSKSKTPFNKEVAPSIDQDTTMSLASTIFSNSQSQQQFFRPISPDASEASEVAASEFLPASSATSLKKKGAPKGVVPVTESDKFDMESRLSGMESVDLAELENPFRSKGPSPQCSPARSTNADVARDPGESKNVSNNGEEKKNRFKISMTSNVRGSPVDKEVSSCTGSSKFDQSVEDVFEGVDEDSPLERYDMPGGDISIIKRSTSQMSDLSESVISTRRENEADGEGVNPGVPTLNQPVEKPAINSETVTLETSTVLSASTKKSLAERSQASSACSTYASSTARDDRSTESKGLENLEDAGFFEYFMAYVSAVMTECANVGATAVGEEYHQDFLTLFSNDACVHPTAEIREQPTSSRQPSVSTKSTSTF
mmetsp:Transcript_8172/g.20096  ORF Transcript_8172/g.20096 Transcript_8172/m.20096 type:complete len:1075 (-) Transcript_8172:1513-4737(-)